MIYHFLKFMTAACVLCIFFGCPRSEPAISGRFNTPITDSVLTETYPNLYDAILLRDDAAILAFTDHKNPKIRRQAWRALAQTPVDSLDEFISKVKQDASAEAWFALSMHELRADQLRAHVTLWNDHSETRAGVGLVLGRQGNEQSLDFLINRLNEISENDFEFEGALRVSRLMIRFPNAEVSGKKIIENAFSTRDSAIIRAWLYGFYRGDATLSAAVKDSLMNRWRDFGIGKSAGVDQYVAGIVGVQVFADIMQHYSSSGKLDEQVQLGIELAQLVDEVEITQNIRKHLKTLLTHSNPHVVQQTLAIVANSANLGSDLSAFIEMELIQNENSSPFVWLEALNAAGSDSAVVQANAARLEAIADANPYLYPKVLQLWMKAESGNSFLDRIGKTLKKDEPLKGMYAINALNQFWSDAHGSLEIKSQVRELTFKALEMDDRGVTFSSRSLLEDSLLFSADDFSRIHSYLQNFRLPGDIEVYQTFGMLYKQRFEQQARPVIDSLAALGYAPLNRSLKQAGWNVEVPEDTESKFRTPDWERLWELGEHPVWVLETVKGTVKVEMNTFSAPATVSAIDSLTRAGAYNGVPFHRVVPNFVIQGGDIERRDGFGGPNFTIPTEPNEQGFVRGAAGIASAGTDTEGSQYFFMHQWKPHLKGGYTLFGNVIEGMNVVDRIIVGDKVERAYWE